MLLKNIRRTEAIMIAAMMAFTMTACGNSNSKTDQAAEATTEEKAQTAAKLTVESGVQLPENFDQMEYPLEALAMESYSLGYPYYVQFSEGSSRDSFWYSVALTAYFLHPEAEDRISVDVDECDMIVSALYAGYQQGSMEIPEIRDGVSYAAYNDENGGYYFSRNDTDYVSSKISDYSLSITACEQTDDGYTVTADLIDADSNTSLGEYTYNIIASNYAGENNQFAYSVTSMSEGSESQQSSSTSSEEADSSTAATDEEGNTIETSESAEDSSESDEEDTDDSGEAASSDYDESDSDSSGEEISQDMALSIAQENYGSGNDYSYQGKEKINGIPYYVYSVSGDDLSISHVLVGTNGYDCVGASQNSDGSWSFDQ